MSLASFSKAYYRPDEVADLFNISRRTVYRLINQRKLRAIKVGGSVRIPEEEVQRLKDRRKKSVNL